MVNYVKVRKHCNIQDRARRKGQAGIMSD